MGPKAWLKCHPAALLRAVLGSSRLRKPVSTVPEPSSQTDSDEVSPQNQLSSQLTRKEELERHGYTVVKGVFPSAEISTIRQTLCRHFARGRDWAPDMLGKHQAHAIAKIPEIEWIYTYPPLTTVFREIFDTDDVVFTGNSDAHINTINFWHKDLNERQVSWFPEGYFNAPDFRLYRAGIYLQDHFNDQRGLHVRVGSHRCASLSSGELKYLPTQIGDVIFFDARLTHAGEMPDRFEYILWRLVRRFGWHTAATYLRNTYSRLVGKGAKISIFLTYGPDNSDTEDFRRLSADRLSA